MVEAVSKVKLDLPCTELVETMAENDKKKCFELLYWQTYSISINLC